MTKTRVEHILNNICYLIQINKKAGFKQSGFFVCKSTTLDESLGLVSQT